MIQEYLQAAMAKAKYEILEDTQTVLKEYCGRIPGFKGLGASAFTLTKCRQELLSTLEEWILLGIRLGHKLPTVEGLQLKVPKKKGEKT